MSVVPFPRRFSAGLLTLALLVKVAAQDRTGALRPAADEPPRRAISSADAARARNAADLERELAAMRLQLQQLEQKTKAQESVLGAAESRKMPMLDAPTGEVVQRRGPASGDHLTSEGDRIALEEPIAGSLDQGQDPQRQDPQRQEPQGQGRETQEQMEKRITENVLRELQPQLAAANKTFPSQFNPSIGLVLDTAFSWKENEGNDFEFRAAELGFAANIDPFTRGYAILTGSPDGFEVEEAAIVTTRLPSDLTLKAGRFFADFGRLSTTHDHDLPFVNRPVVLDRFIGGESQGDGVEVNWLVPVEHYVTLTAGAYDKIGAENMRVDSSAPRDLGRFTYLGRGMTSFELGAAHTLDVGASYAYSPRVTSFTDDAGLEVREGNARGLGGLDVTYRYAPLGEAQYRGFIWGTEVLFNHEDQNLGDATTPDIQDKRAWGMYSYVEAKLSRQYSPGFLFDFAQDEARATADTKAYSPYLTVWLSEFNRLRFQYTYVDEPGNHESQFFIQWTVILGSHTHGFNNR